MYIQQNLIALYFDVFIIFYCICLKYWRIAHNPEMYILLLSEIVLFFSSKYRAALMSLLRHFISLCMPSFFTTAC